MDQLRVGGAVRYRLLGQLEVIGDDGRNVAFAGDKERILLAALLLGANRVVSTERLIDVVWGQRPPQRPANALQVQVSRLRRKLTAAAGDRELLASEPSGYRLAVQPGELDVASFEELINSPEGPPAEVSGRLAEALGLWRGRALADVACDALQGEAVRLDELRWTALERRIDADLELSRHHILVGELHALVAGRRRQPTSCSITTGFPREQTQISPPTAPASTCSWRSLELY
jgi:DNA-binding SARP family transcriptional activator